MTTSRTTDTKGTGQHAKDYLEWLDFFTSAVLARQQNLHARLDVMRQASQLPELQNKIFGLLEQRDKLLLHLGASVERS